MRPRWNHNIHYHSVLLSAMPPGCERVLDVGCGEGGLARKLRGLGCQVTAIDRDESSVRVAQEDGSGIEYVVGDFMTFPFEPRSFDFVVSVAALHHMDEAVALRRMRELVRAGGAVAVVGLARSSYPADAARDGAAVVVNRLHRLARNHWESSAPEVWPPLHTYDDVRAIAERELPGARFRRHLLFRYSIVWTPPTDSRTGSSTHAALTAWRT
ncbi:MAG TPA: class I SAM-dependent methyltransferase [Solirubrobacteraceae bacterium]|nr:class I SAM-dependent methyltransferase [Solirubrobacteraceae bacterium]